MVTKCPSSHPDFQYADRKQKDIIDFYISRFARIGKKGLPTLQNEAFFCELLGAKENISREYTYNSYHSN